MSGRRFFVPEGTLDVAEPRLATELAHRAARVLRLAPGDRLRLFDGSGREALAEIVDVSRDSLLTRVLSMAHPATEPAVAVTLCQALLPSDRFDWALEKATELGVAAFIPLLAARATAKPDSDATTMDRKLRRWRSVVQAAAEQSGRVRLPTVSAPRSWAALVAGMPTPAIVAWEESTAPLSASLASLSATKPGSVWLVVGPEGGLTESEVASAVAAGATVVSLGPRTLRSETAGVALAALTLHALGALTAGS